MKAKWILFVRSVQAFAERYRLLIACVTAAAFAGLLALSNVSSGPLRNLNDIGGWNNRALFILMTAGVHAVLLVLCAVLGRVRLSRTVLRQVIVTAGIYIMQTAINHKTYHYINVIQPVVRAMDAGGLAAGAAMDSPLSAPALLLTYLITRGPVYDMYLLKLFASACYLFAALLLTRFADRRGFGIRAEVLLALCAILPQGFMNAACSALPELAALALLGLSLTLAFDMAKPKMTAAAICFGTACALCGACLYALPVFAWLAYKGKLCTKQMLIMPGVMLALCLPAVLAGMPVFSAAASLFEANFGLPPYAGGAPGMVHIIPRAVVEEMPQYAPTLRHLPQLDLTTYEQLFYTKEHFAVVMHGMTLGALAAYLGLCAWVWRAEKESALHRVLTLTLGALIICPNVTSGAWLAVDLLCLYAILSAPKLRLPACMILFATAAGSCYPMTEEVLVPMIAAFALCLGALLMLTGVIPMEKEEAAHE